MSKSALPILSLCLAVCGGVGTALAQGLDFLDGKFFATEGMCDAIASQGDAAFDGQRDAMILSGQDGMGMFHYTAYPGACKIDGILNPALSGRGSDLPTAMVTLSCIDDVAVPQFGICALEYWPDEEEPSRVDVYTVASDELEHIAGSYQQCDGAAAESLQRMFGG